MCGIAGTIGTVDPAVIQAMTDALRHRGPDDAGTHTEAELGFAFGHRRLAIIDLSPAGHQPMSWAEGRFWITYNGEIYNYRELRHELEQAGCVFRTHTDTEVVLAAYATWGDRCLERFRGMFAFALADRQSGEVFLARDRFGIKPLLYAARPGEVLFASELRALRASGKLAGRIDRQAVWDYLSLGSVPQPATILADARMLSPGSAMRIGFDGTVRRLWRWWRLSTAASPLHDQTAAMDFDAATAALLARLEEATRYHLVADVPVGAFLSGGIDSAAIVALMGRALRSPIQTFTVGFEPQHGLLDESQAAAVTAQQLGTDHHAVVVTDAEAASAFDDLIEAIDQPSLDGANTWFVARAAARHTKVVLTGLGGDELFAGYPHFRRHRLAARLRSLTPWPDVLWGALRVLPDRFRHNLMLPALSEPERFATLRCLMTDRAKAAATAPAFRTSFSSDALARLYRLPAGSPADVVDRLSQAELEGYMANTLLRDGDAMSMAHGLEARPILLDHELATFAFALPGACKLRGGRGKAVFTAALRQVLPVAVLSRPKRGFELPLLRWLAGPLRERADAAFASETARGVFAAPFLADARRRLRQPGPRDTRLWPCVILVEWLRQARCSL